MHNLEVLIVDDNGYMHEILRVVLRAFGITNVTSSFDPVAGLELAQSKHFDLIILDVRMPVVDGGEFLQFLRGNTDKVNSRCPVIIVSAYSEKSKVRELRDLGANSFVRKPFTARDLFQHIQMVLRDNYAFIEAGEFKGPDRRRPKRAAQYKGDERREDGDNGEAPDAAESA